jgi:hypothetical protein
MGQLLLHTRPEHNKPDARNQKSYGDRCRDLRRFLFINGCFDGTEFRYFLLLVIIETRVDQSNDTQDQEDHSENDDQ